VSEHDHDHEQDHDEHEHPPEDEADVEEEHDAEEDAEAEARRRIALSQIRQYGDPALRLKAHEVTEFDDELDRLAERMALLMEDAQGVGLAATQVGVLRRLFVFVPDGEEARTVVNPRVAERSDETETDDEGCLSLHGVRVPVERSVRLVLEGQDAAGEDVRYELEGYAARVAQHELDHLDGVLILDRTDDEHRKLALAILRPRVVLR
jgi:peptide deformylase